MFSLLCGRTSLCTRIVTHLLNLFVLMYMLPFTVRLALNRHCSLLHSRSSQSSGSTSRQPTRVTIVSHQIVPNSRRAPNPQTRNRTSSFPRDRNLPPLRSGRSLAPLRSARPFPPLPTGDRIRCAACVVRRLRRNPLLPRARRLRRRHQRLRGCVVIWIVLNGSYQVLEFSILLVIDSKFVFKMVKFRCKFNLLNFYRVWTDFGLSYMLGQGLNSSVKGRQSFRFIPRSPPTLKYVNYELRYFKTFLYSHCEQLRCKFKVTSKKWSDL